MGVPSPEEGTDQAQLPFASLATRLLDLISTPLGLTERGAGPNGQRYPHEHEALYQSQVRDFVTLADKLLCAATWRTFATPACKLYTPVRAAAWPSSATPA